MYVDEANDNRSLDEVISKNLPEAVNAVHQTAPVVLLEGKDYTFSASDAPAGESISYGDDERDEDYCVLHFSLANDAAFLRLVAFQAADSPIVVTDIIPQASAEGRKQLNRHIRGRYDRPRLVQGQGRHTAPSFDYYSLLPSTIEAKTPIQCVGRLSFIKEQFYSAPTMVDNVLTYPNYDISRRLRQNIIEYLTAMVLETYGDERAQAWYTKAASFPTL